MSSLETFMYRNFIAGARLQAVKSKVPPRPKQQEAKQNQGL